MAAVTAFREPYLISQPAEQDANFTSWEARQLRYALYWAFYENTAYSNIQNWARSYKRDAALYRYIRNIHSPAYRLGTFWQTHLMGGQLDPAAGDGGAVPSALPIVVPEDNANADALRRALAELWTWSNWQTRKDIYTLWGSLLGDVALRVHDDTGRRRVYLEVLHPQTIKWVEQDPFGNVKAYILEEERADPRPKKTGAVTYTEKCYREQDSTGRNTPNVVFETYLDNRLYDWFGWGAQWATPYGFAPLVVVQHNDVGLDWGWSAMHAARSRFQEVDDIAANLDDQIRKMVNAQWFFTGVTAPGSTPTSTSRDSETYQETSSATDRPQPGREEVNALYSSKEGANAIPLVSDLDIAAVNERIKELVGELERELPELQLDIWSVDAPSGRALRIARQRAEAKVIARRNNYDAGLVKAQQMALAIGGWRSYEAFAGFGLDSFAAGSLDHTIGSRPVFAQDPLDGLEVDKEFWTVAGQAVEAGCPLPVYLQEQGWDEERIARLTDTPEYQSQLAQLKLATLGLGGLQGGDNG